MKRTIHFNICMEQDTTLKTSFFFSKEKEKKEEKIGLKSLLEEKIYKK